MNDKLVSIQNEQGRKIKHQINNPIEVMKIAGTFRTEFRGYFNEIKCQKIKGKHNY